MTAKELQKRGAKAEMLRVLQTEDGSFYAESAEGKILRVYLQVKGLGKDDVFDSPALGSAQSDT